MRDDAVAIVGMACVFPGAGDLATFWTNIRDGVDAISEVPLGRWDAAFYEHETRRSDRLPCRRGGFIDAFARFDPLKYGIMPVAARAAEPDQLLALDAAAAALRDAGLSGGIPSGITAGVILGRGNYTGSGCVRLEQHVRGAEQLITALQTLVPDLEPAELSRVRAAFQAQIGASSSDGIIGLVPNLTASRIAHCLDLRGPAHTVDAACASALVALDQACLELRAGRADLMLAGGVHVCHAEAFWSVFHQLGALSASQRIRPFSSEADGLLIGEGVGILALKRLSDADRDGDRVYAVVRGTGRASDGRAATLLSPASSGQQAAIRMAWIDAGLDPKDIGLLEAHGTATQVGDRVEVETLAACFGSAPEPRAVVGSVKSIIGHAMPASGAAALIKTALAIHHRVLPPTLHCERPREDLRSTVFETLSSARHWSDSLQVAGVNAFGFGGINAHVVLTGHARSDQRAALRSSTPSASARTRPMCFAAASPAELLERLAARRTGGAGPVRLGLLDPTPERLAKARSIVEGGRAASGRLGIVFSPQAMLQDGGRVGFVFPGLDAIFEPQLGDLARHFAIGLPAGIADASLETRGKAVCEVNRFMLEVLRRSGVHANAVAGHSIGEWNALEAARVVSSSAVEALSATLAPGSLKLADAALVVAACSAQRAAAVIVGLEDTVLTHDNCPRQAIVCGPRHRVDEIRRRFASASIATEVFPFTHGAHSPFLAPLIEAYRQNIDQLGFERPALPIYSGTTARRFPDDPDAIRELTIAHLTRPVMFTDMIERMYAEGVRVFVQVGFGSLIGFVEDILRGRPHRAVASNTKARSGLGQLEALLVTLWTEGADLDPLQLTGAVRAANAVAASRAPAVELQLALGVPLVRFDQPLRLPHQRAVIVPPVGANRVVAAFQDNLARMAAAQADVLALGARPAPSAAPRETVRRFDLDHLPELRDHAFFRQPVGWSDVEDTQPVVPMTALLEIVQQAVATSDPSLKTNTIEQLWAKRWLTVVPGVDVAVEVHDRGPSERRVTIGDFAEALVHTSRERSVAPNLRYQRLVDEEACEVDAAALYRNHWMFHGPAYQTVRSIDGIAPTGIRGRVAVGAGLGSMLDGCGQLLGLWVMLRTDVDRLAMPVKLRKICLFEAHPPQGAELECSIAITKLGASDVIADMTLWWEGRVFATVEGWRDQRFQTDERMWRMIRWPGRSCLSERLGAGVVSLGDRYRASATLAYAAGRYLNSAERKCYAAEQPAKRRDWLLRAIAAKDALRDLLWADGCDEVFPAELHVREGRAGRLEVRGQGRKADVVIDSAGPSITAHAKVLHEAIHLYR